MPHATSPGQDTYNPGAAFTYPLTYSAPANGANYWVDVEVTPAQAPPPAPQQQYVYQMRRFP